MWSKIAREAPAEFDQQFLLWLRQLEDRLLVKLADWHPSSVEQVQWYAKIINQRIPRDLKLYYGNAYPFGLLRNGWRKWNMRREEYRATWTHSLINILDVNPNEAETLVNTSPPLWPIDCLGKKHDIVCFIWENGELAVIELDLLNGGKGKPVSIGLRNCFLVGIVLEMLAEDKVEIDFDELGQHPMVLKVSGWPKESLSQKHVALTINELLRQPL